MTYEDLMHSGKGLMALNELLLLRGPQRPARSVPRLPSFGERDSHLLDYCTFPYSALSLFRAKPV